MARNRKRKSLYEVMSKARLKATAGKKIGPLRQEKCTKETTAPSTGDTAVPEESVMWWKKPKLIRFNAGRIEISLPYQLAIALILVLVLLILVAFRLGQIERRTANSIGQIQTGEQINPAGVLVPGGGQNSASSERLSPTEERFRPVEPQGDHVIVLVQYHRRADLVPVREHFAQNGIETQIVQEGNWYFLVTKDRYQNPSNPGTDGYQALQRIIEVGAQYEGKAPTGRETFSPHFFRDAYGKKVE
jgi:hypothetical protein